VVLGLALIVWVTQSNLSIPVAAVPTSAVAQPCLITDIHSATDGDNVTAAKVHQDAKDFAHAALKGTVFNNTSVALHAYPETALDFRN
jgi:hypothetical protein